MQHDKGHGEALDVLRRTPRPSTENENEEIRMMSRRQRLPHTRPAASHALGRPLVRRHGNRELIEVELWVGGDEHEQEHAGEPHHVGFIGRLIADSEGLSIAQKPRIRVYETKNRKLVVYRDWREGATYSLYPDIAALQNDGTALKTLWLDDGGKDFTERPDIEEKLLRHVADSLREKFVLRIV
jgi:hypothetical protein